MWKHTYSLSLDAVSPVLPPPQRSSLRLQEASSFIFAFTSGPPVKQGASLLLGLSITIATCHIHTLHSLVTVIGIWIIIKSSWR